MALSHSLPVFVRDSFPLSYCFQQLGHLGLDVNFKAQGESAIWIITYKLVFVWTWGAALDLSSVTNVNRQGLFFWTLFARVPSRGLCPESTNIHFATTI